MDTEVQENRTFVSYVSPSGSAVEVVTLAALFVAICGCLGRAALHFV